MSSNPQQSYNKPIYLQPIVRPVKYLSAQGGSYQGEEVKLSSPENYQSNEAIFDQYETTNYNNQVNDINIDNYTQDNVINQTNQIYSFGTENQIDITNQENTNNQYDYTNIDTNNYNNYDNQIASYNEYNVSNTPNYTEQIKSYNEYNVTNTPNYTEQIKSYTPYEETNQINSYYQENSYNISYQPNEVYTENQTNENPIISFAEKVSDKIINTANEVKEKLSIGNPLYSVNLSQANDNSGVNQINQIYANESSDINALKSINTVPKLNLNINSDINLDKEKEFQNEEKIEKTPKKLDSPRLIDPLATPYPPSPVLISKHKEGEYEERNNLQENNKLEESNVLKGKNTEYQKYQQYQKNQQNLQNQEKKKKKMESNILTQDEKGLLNIEKSKNIFKDYNVKSQYDLTLIKEAFGFNYTKIHKTGVPLLSHFEMPQNYEYKSPILSDNGKYLSCIAHGKEDLVYVWDVNDLYWYKYKYSASNVDGISFTPDSKSIIIIYRYANPTMYSLSNGKKILDFEENGEEKKREVFECAYIKNDPKKDPDFAYTTDKSFTIWDLKTGEIKQQIFDDSPIKIISNDYLILISSDLNVIIKKIPTLEDAQTFKLKGVESPNDILDARVSKDLSSFIYVIKDGIIKYTFNDQEYKGLQKFEFDVIKARISDDCKHVIKTNMQNISVYDIDKQDSICTLLKEKFKEFNVNLSQKKIIVIDDICIDIQQYDDDGAPEKYVWLDKNPKKFEDVKFSRDCKVLLARINRNNAIAYDLKTGYIVKKWQNIDENWLDYSMTKYGGDNIATKSHLLLVRVWNFTTGREEASFYGYDSHSFCFSGNGLYLACGTKSGSEIARIWDIYKQRYGIFRFNGNNNNFHTVVHLTSPEPKYLICCAVDQKPLIFNTHTRQLLYSCECPYRFEEVYGIQSDLMYDVFIVKGKDETKRNIGLLYRISDGSLLEVYENYVVLELAKNNGAIIVKCENINGKKLSSINIKNLGDPITNDFQIQSDKCKLLDDYKVAVIEFGDEYTKEFHLINVENGTIIGKFHFVKKNDKKSAAYITVDPYTREMYFRYLEFLNPQETMLYKGKDIFNVVDE